MVYNGPLALVIALIIIIYLSFFSVNNALASESTNETENTAEVCEERSTEVPYHDLNYNDECRLKVFCTGPVTRFIRGGWWCETGFRIIVWESDPTNISIGTNYWLPRRTYRCMKDGVYLEDDLVYVPGTWKTKTETYQKHITVAENRCDSNPNNVSCNNPENYDHENCDTNVSNVCGILKSIEPKIWNNTNLKKEEVSTTLSNKNSIFNQNIDNNNTSNSLSSETCGTFNIGNRTYNDCMIATFLRVLHYPIIIRLTMMTIYK